MRYLDLDTARNNARLLALSQGVPYVSMMNADASKCMAIPVDPFEFGESVGLWYARAIIPRIYGGFEAWFVDYVLEPSINDSVIWHRPEAYTSLNSAPPNIVPRRNTE